MSAHAPTPADVPDAATAPAVRALSTLDRVSSGSPARVAAVSGDDTLRRRLLEMGLVPGTLVTVLRRAPLGDPIELTARGYLLSLRISEARQVSIEV